MAKQTFLIFLLIAIVTACTKAELASVPNSAAAPAATTIAIQEPSTTPTPLPTNTATAINTPTPTNTSTATSTPTITPTATPSGPPSFANLRFAAAPAAEPRRAFGYETDEVYALWEYSNMNENVVVKRRWDLTGEEIIREEVWDMETYGSSGTVSDVFIFDYENEGGLAPGLYSLDLYINGQRVIFAPFSINSSWSVTHEGTGRRAFVKDNTLLMIEESDGQQRQVAEALEIHDLVWMPDGRYLLYSEWDRTEQIWHTSMGLERTMWLIDVDTGEQIMLGDNYHTPIIGSDGRYLAVYVGDDFHDACDFGRQLRFLQLASGAVVAQHKLADFAG